MQGGPSACSGFAVSREPRMLISIILIGVISTGFMAILLLVGMRASKLSRELEASQRNVAVLQGNVQALSSRLVALQEVDAKNVGLLGLLEHAEKHIAKLEADLDERPAITRKTYKILTLGVKATGKTSLTLKWSNPLIDLGTMEGTKIERYQRTVSQVRQRDLVTEHVFEVHDWGGEHIVDAQQELIVEEINGMLIVVDLGGEGARQVV